jgi:hypothetical protein
MKSYKTHGYMLVKGLYSNNELNKIANPQVFFNPL